MRQAKLLGQKILFNKWGKKFCTDTLKMQDGAIIDWSYISGKEGAMIIALDTEKNIILVRQYRYTIKDFTYENCAGGIEEGESKLVTAKRELLEETGYKSENIIPLGNYYDLPNETNHWCHMFLALDCQLVSKPVLDDTEKYSEMSVKILPFMDVYNSLGTDKSFIKSSEHSFGIFLARKFLTSNNSG